MDIISLKNIIEQLGRKKIILTRLDGKIVALTEDPNKLEQDIFDTEEIQDEKQETLSQISRFIQLTLSTKKPTQQPPIVVNQEPTQLSVNPRSLKGGEVERTSPLRFFGLKSERLDQLLKTFAQLFFYNEYMF